jgi:integration host factor subunit alpha
MTKTKEHIAHQIYKAVGLPKKEVVVIVDSVFDIIRETLQKEDKLKICGFGTFSALKKKPRMGRNPHTGDDLVLEARRVISFKPGTELRARLNNGSAEELSEAEEDTYEKENDIFAPDL